VSHLQISAVESEPHRSLLGLLGSRVGPNQAGDLQYTDAGVEHALPGQHGDGSPGSRRMAQISWQSRAMHRHEVLPLKLSHRTSEPYRWLRFDGAGQNQR
jgi:hypothetical protein